MIFFGSKGGYAGLYFVDLRQVSLRGKIPIEKFPFFRSFGATFDVSINIRIFIIL